MRDQEVLPFHAWVISRSIMFHAEKVIKNRGSETSIIAKMIFIMSNQERRRKNI